MPLKPIELPLDIAKTFVVALVLALKGNAAMAMRILAIVLAIAGAVCWLWPGAIGGLLFRTLPISARESVIIGALFFVGAAILWFVKPRDDKEP